MNDMGDPLLPDDVGNVSQLADVTHLQLYAIERLVRQKETQSAAVLGGVEPDDAHPLVHEQSDGPGTDTAG